MPHEPHLSYADPARQGPTGRRRSAGAWLALLLVWAVGLAVWLIYLIAIVYVVFRLF